MKTAAERVDEALVGEMIWISRSACIALIEAAVAEEREECAQISESLVDDEDHLGYVIAQYIRERSE